MVLLLLVSGCAARGPSDDGGGPPGESPQGVEFLVEAPGNTPEGDTVWIYMFQDGHKMEKVGDHTYRFVLNDSNQDTIRYRYSRNGYNFRTAEYLAPSAEEPDRDTNDYFWTKAGRETQFSPGKVQHDVIVRWRFFPEGALPPGATSLEPRGTFLPRVDGATFRSGQTIEDLYESAYADFFNSTAARLVSQGYTWAELDPPWQWKEEDGLPRVVNDEGNSPNYPDDATFLRELAAYKGVGLRAMIAPQLCCTPLSTTNRSAAWWDAYISETERFLAHFAGLAQQGGADAFSYAVPAFELGQVPDNGERWSRIFSAIRARFSGLVGEMVWVLGPDVSPTPQITPDTGFIEWGNDLDFFLVHTDFPLSTQDAPTDLELETTAREVANGTKVLYDTFGKPVLLRNGYFNVRYSWKGQTFYSINSVPWIADPEAALNASVYRFDTHDHARTVNAMFEGIARSPWVVGYFHFGYTHWVDPLSPWMSVRGKPAEDVWRKWNEAIYGDA